MIFPGFRAGHGRPGTGPPEAPSESPETIDDRNSSLSTPGSAWEPQNTRSNILEPSHIDWSTQTDSRPPRSQIKKFFKIQFALEPPEGRQIENPTHITVAPQPRMSMLTASENMSALERRRRVRYSRLWLKTRRNTFGANHDVFWRS